MITFKIGTAVAAATATLTLGAGTTAATAAVDSTPPSVPQNVHITGLSRGNPIISWNGSTDDSGAILHYWVLVDGQQRAKPKATSYNIDTLYLLDRITVGPHVITVQAVDPSLNRSKPSAPLSITVVP